MADRYPLAMNACGAAFASLFIGYRVVLWPVVSLHFW